MNLFDLIPVPSHWTSQSIEVEEIELSAYHSEYRSVKCKLEGQPLRGLTKITRVQNPYLYKRYLLRKLEYQTMGRTVEEKDLLHATAEHKIQPIINDNLDWRMANRVKFGRGVSFSPSATYANQECSRSNGCDRAIIVTKVLVGRVTSGCYSTLVPPEGYDTTYDNRGNVYVKYYDDEFYPEYVAYYNL